MGDVIELDAAPNLKLLYARAVVTSAVKGSSWPTQTLLRRGVRTDHDAVAAYSRVCGFPLTGTLPLTYPHIVSFPLAVQLMAQPSFPLPLAGLVHIRNHIRAHRAIGLDEPLTVRVRLSDLRPHPKGRQFDIVASAEVEGHTVWEEVSTNLHRGKADEDATGDPSLESEVSDSATWRVPKDIGRRYAAVSGDVNPIHLHPLTARLFGFPRAIAHGMWTKARAVAALAERLPDTCSVAVEFRKPLLLPATVRFGASHNSEGWSFAVRSRSGSAHLFGLVTSGDAA